MKLGEAMYQAQAQAAPGTGGAQPGPEGAPGAAAGSEKVVDADFEEVDEKKRGSA